MTEKKINIKLIPVKAHYFFFNAAGSALVPFLPVMGKQMGISAEAVGIVYAVAPIAGCVAKPFFGLVADRLKKRKKTFLFFLLLALTSSLSFSFLPQVQPERPVIFECGSMGTNYLLQSGGAPASCTAERSLDNIKRKSTSSQNHNSTTQSLVEDDEELCHIDCQIYSFLDGIKFCYNLRKLNVNDLPEPCKGTANPVLANVDKNGIYDETEAFSIRHNISEVTSSSVGVHEDNNQQLMVQPEPYILNFEVILKMPSTVLLKDTIFLHVDRISFHPGNGKFKQFSCNERTRLTKCFVNCSDHTQLNKRLERVLEEPEVFESSTFWLYGALVVLAFAAIAVSNSISDALCFQILGDKPQNYGMQRQWGAIGWGIFTLVAGYLVDRISRGMLLKDYTPCFYLLAILYAIDLLVAYKWDVKEEDKPKQIRRDVWNLVTDLRVIIFGLACIIVGMCTGMHWNFLFWYIEDMAASECGMMEWIKVLQGVMVAVQCFSELPFFHFAGWFLKKLGYVHCMTLVLFTFGIRFLIYSVITHPWAFVPVELFQGITFGIFYSVMTSYASHISPPGAASTIQGLVGAVFEGIGIAAGSLVGGILLHTWGGKIAYRMFGFGALFFCLLHGVLTFFLVKLRVYEKAETSGEREEGQEMYKVTGVSQEIDAEDSE